MSDKNLRIQVILSALDKVTAPLRSIGGASSKTRKELKATQAELTALAKQNKLIATFRQLKTGVGQLDTELEQARTRASMLGKEISQVEQPTRKMTRAFNAARREVDQLETKQQAQQRSLNALRRELREAGVLIGIIAAIVVVIGALILGAKMLRDQWALTALGWNDAWAGIKDLALQFMTWFNTLPEAFQTIGKAMMQGLITGIQFMLNPLKTTMAAVSEMLPAVVKEKLGIHSPSRVFAGIGQDTMDGLAVGLRRGQRGPIDNVRMVAGQIAGAMAVGTGAGVASASAAPAATPAASYSIVVNAAPGMDEQLLARLVAAEIDTRDRAAASRSRSALADGGD